MESARTQFFGQSRLLFGLLPQQLEQVLSVGEEASLPEGETIMQEGTTEDTLWIVEAGEVEVFKAVGIGVERTLAYVSAGSVLGELEFVDAGPRAASARTSQPSAFVRIARPALETAVAADPSIGVVVYRNIGEIIGERLRTTNELYRESVVLGLEAMGAAALNLHRLVENLSDISIRLQSGVQIRGRLLQVDQNPGGYALVLKDAATQKIAIIPYHAVQAIEVE